MSSEKFVIGKKVKFRSSVEQYGIIIEFYVDKFTGRTKILLESETEFKGYCSVGDIDGDTEIEIDSEELIFQDNY